MHSEGERMGKIGKVAIAIMALSGAGMLLIVELQIHGVGRILP